jgi:two-component system KDP operon response regulator KdpE
MTIRDKILVVEDDAHIQTLLQALLESVGFKVILAGSCSAAQVMHASYIPDLIILDLGLPDQDGIVFLKKLREESSVPVTVLSVRMEEDDKVAALDEGANDYVTKPFGSAELLARVRSALRNSRSGTSDAKGSRFVLKDLVIDYDSRRTFLHGEEIKVTQTEFNIIALLAENCGKMMTYSAIVKAIWGYSSEGSVKKLQVNMANIRRKFGTKPGETSYIINEVGVGYRMLRE